MSFPYKWYYDFAIGVSLEVIRGLESFSNNSMVIDFSVDCQGDALVAVREGLSSAFNTHNTQTFVSKNYGM
jgi:hypothetical protein